MSMKRVRNFRRNDSEKRKSVKVILIISMLSLFTAVGLSLSIGNAIQERKLKQQRLIRERFLKEHFENLGLPPESEPESEPRNIIRKLRQNYEQYRIKDLENYDTQRFPPIINFPPGSISISHSEKQKLKQWIKRLTKEQKKDEIIIIGKADQSGTDEYNLGISQQRANKVAALLETPEFNLNVIDAYGVGNQYDDGSSDEERRVEIYFLSDIRSEFKDF